LLKLKNIKLLSEHLIFHLIKVVFLLQEVVLKTNKFVYGIHLLIIMLKLLKLTHKSVNYNFLKTLMNLSPHTDLKKMKSLSGNIKISPKKPSFLAMTKEFFISQFPLMVKPLLLDPETKLLNSGNSFLLKDNPNLLL
jgi:hypothetical protein